MEKPKHCNLQYFTPASFFHDLCPFNICPVVQRHLQFSLSLLCEWQPQSLWSWVVRLCITDLPNCLGSDIMKESQETCDTVLEIVRFGSGMFLSITSTWVWWFQVAGHPFIDILMGLSYHWQLGVRKLSLFLKHLCSPQLLFLWDNQTNICIFEYQTKSKIVKTDNYWRVQDPVRILTGT